jgi:hypothetical protein
MIYNVIDVIANFPFFIQIFSSFFSSNIDHRTIQTFRVFQTLRLLRLGKSSNGLKALLNTFKAGKHDIFLMILVYGLSAFILSSIIYMVEHEEPDSKFESIPTAFYFMIVTMTTV